MCNELKLIQTKYGIYNIKKWNMNENILHFADMKGIYILVNINTWKYLIGEGLISDRLRRHYYNKSQNTLYNRDYIKYGKDSFQLIGYIPEENAKKRKEIEYRLHIFFSSKTYNKPCIPKDMILELIKQGKNKKEILDMFGCSDRTITQYLKRNQNSRYIGVCLDKQQNWRAYLTIGSRNNKTVYYFGSYHNESDASKNRDYFIIKAGYFSNTKLNHYNIDYNNFKPCPMINGKINKFLE